MPPGLSLSYNGTGSWERLDRRGQGSGPLVEFDDVLVRDRVDAEFVGQAVSRALFTAGFG